MNYEFGREAYEAIRREYIRCNDEVIRLKKELKNSILEERDRFQTLLEVAEREKKRAWDVYFEAHKNKGKIEIDASKKDENNRTLEESIDVLKKRYQDLKREVKFIEKALDTEKGNFERIRLNEKLRVAKIELDKAWKKYLAAHVEKDSSLVRFNETVDRIEPPLETACREGADTNKPKKQNGEFNGRDIPKKDGFSMLTPGEQSFRPIFERLLVSSGRYTLSYQTAFGAIVRQYRETKLVDFKVDSDVFNSQVDFMVCDKKGRIKAIIEINDKTHNRSDRRDRDHKLKEACKKMGVPFISFWCKYGADEHFIKWRFLEAGLDVTNK